ncbi:hypothetical protein EDD16DRAFT_1692641 [Pisolithus croceorrhizus]|nr:hypothetical protein EDD16DRAFT_1692641 [Pisolithus croceorrhizus]
MDARLSQLAALSQKDKTAGYLALLSDVLAQSNQGSATNDLQLLVDTVVNQESVGFVVGRQVLTELVKSLSIARVLMGISLDSGSRFFRIYIRIIRLLLEDEDSVQAETYYNRAASLSNSTADRETLLQFKLSAMRYHELSWAADIDEEERKELLSSAVTCAVLAPAGPNRSRVLASLYRDERSSELQTYNILSKMFLDHILRPGEIKSFEQTLKPHQLARIAISSNDRLASTVDDEESSLTNASKRTGPSTVLDRAVMEHNLLATETMARKMIEQGRLKGSIDQVDKLIWFDGGKEEDDAQGKAGGLGDVEQTTEDTGAPLTKRWDMQIRITAANVEAIVQHLAVKGLVAATTSSV